MKNSNFQTPGPDQFMYELETSRLKLRQWKQQDLPAFAQLNADPQVMEYFPDTLSQFESNAMAKQIQSLIDERGWGFWAVEEKTSHCFIGFTGLHIPTYDLPFKPCVEIGWRLAKQFWGKGYATEAAHAALELAFTRLKLDEVVSFTTVTNRRSRAVMERLAMKNTQQNFLHPAIPENHPLQEHVLYKINHAHWLQSSISMEHQISPLQKI